MQSNTISQGWVGGSQQAGLDAGYTPPAGQGWGQMTPSSTTSFQMSPIMYAQLFSLLGPKLLGGNGAPSTPQRGTPGQMIEPLNMLPKQEAMNPYTEMNPLHTPFFYFLGDRRDRT